MNHLASLTQCLGIALLFLGFAACFSPPNHSRTTARDLLTYGRGGGVAGQETTYLLYRDGQLFTVKSFSSDTLLLTTVSLETTEALFDRTEALDMAVLDFRRPGNLYYFIRHQEAEVVWGKPSDPPPSGIQSLYDSLQRLIPNQ